MTTRRRVKAPQPQLVGVIASSADLDAAVNIKQLPDLFELRLDSLFPITNRLEKKISCLRAPLIVTARDPGEGGTGNLALATRRGLLQRFLPHAMYIDIELRAAPSYASLLADAKKRKVRRILSYHNFKSTPSSRSLCAKATQAQALGADIFKVATRTDTPETLSRLVDFLTHPDLNLPASAMGIGKLGAISRLMLMRCGSVLAYASLKRPNAEGQLPIEVLRSGLGH
jgi:3-dehydroquinate dehydratase-1